MKIIWKHSKIHFNNSRRKPRHFKLVFFLKIPEIDVSILFETLLLIRYIIN